MVGNDNRMRWIRNLEKLSKKDNNSYIEEYEIATECHISGVLNYNNSMILCGGLSVQKDRNGLYHYLLKVQYANIEESYNNKANKKGYYFPDDILGELLSILSLYFRCRFYLVAIYSGTLTEFSLRRKIEHRFTYKPCNPVVHPPIFSTKKRNFTIGLTDFLDNIKLLNIRYHQQFIWACYHYMRSLKEIGNDREMVFIRLVSAIESLSKSIILNKDQDLFNGKFFKDIIKIEVLPETEIEELEKIFKNRKSKVKFITFIEKHSSKCFNDEDCEENHCKITKKQLPKVLSTIYNARSAYLHNGERMYISEPMYFRKECDTEPCGKMIIDNRLLPVSQKLPFTYFFERIVQQCLFSFLKDNILN